MKNAFDKFTDSKIVRASLIIIAIFLMIFLSRIADAQEQPRYGYLIVIENNNETLVRRTDSLKTLQNIIQEHYPDSGINAEEQFKGSAYFEIRSFKKRFYVEIRRITDKGKYRKLTRNEFKLFESGKKGIPKYNYLFGEEL